MTPTFASQSPIVPLTPINEQTDAPVLDPVLALEIARSRYAETVVQAAYGARGRNSQGARSRGLELLRSVAVRGRARLKRIVRSDGLMETLVTLLATIFFGLSWAAIETIGVEAKTSYAASPVSAHDHDHALANANANANANAHAPTSTLSSNGAPNTQWTDEPLARSRR